MSVAATLKQNTMKRGFSYYGGIPRCLCVPSLGLTIFTRLLGGLFSSFSGKKDENGNISTFTCTREGIKDLIGCSITTISRSTRQLKAAELVTRKGMSEYEFKQDKLDDSTKKWSFPFEIATREFEMTDDDGNVFRRMLTPGAILSYSWLYTKLSSVTHKTTIDVVYKEVADELGIDESTVSDAMKLLRWAKLIYFPKEFVGANRYKKSKVGLIRRWSWFRAEKQYRERQCKAQNKTYKQPGNAPITRELYYGELQATAKSKASEAREEARLYEDYRTLDDKISSLNAMYRKELFNDAIRAQELSEQINVLNAQRVAVLDNIGISEAQLQLEYYTKCKKCKDTGWLPNGKPCRCFKPRGAPSERGMKNNVGEQ